MPGYGLIGDLVIGIVGAFIGEWLRPRIGTPFAELMLASFIVVGLSMAMRIEIPLVPALAAGDSSALHGVVTQFWERLPGIITPFTCTISLGLLCSYVDFVNRTSFRVAAVGVLGNGLALSAAGFFVGRLLEDSVLAQFFSVQQIKQGSSSSLTPD